MLHSRVQQQYEPYWVKGAGHNDVAERREYFERQYREQCENEGLEGSAEIQMEVYEQMQVNIK